MHDELETAFKPKGGLMIPAIVVALGIGAAAVVFMILKGDALGNPIRVAVAMRGSVSESFDDRLGNGFVNGLESFGLQGIRVDDAPEGAAGDELYAALRRSAYEADAGHVLLLDLDAERERDGFTDDSGLFRVGLTVQLVPADPGQPAYSDSMAFAYETTSVHEAAINTLDAWFEGLFPEVIRWLYESPSLGPALAGEVSVDELELTGNLRDRRDAVEARTGRILAYQAYCEDERAALQAYNEADNGIQCVGDPCGQWTVVGLDADGRHAIVQDISRRLIVSIPYGGVQWAESPESFLAVPLQVGGEPRTLLRTANIYGFGEVSASGRYATVSAIIPNSALAVVSLDTGTGEWLDVNVLLPGHRANRALPSPQGDRSLLHARARSRHSDYMWMIADGVERVAQPWEGYAMWLPDGSGTAGRLPDDRFAVAGPDGEVIEPSVELPGPVRQSLGARDGVLWLIWRTESGDCELGGVALADHALVPGTPLPDCPDWPDLLPDGRLVGTAYTTSEGDTPGDAEVVVIDPTDQTMTPLTSGTYREELTFATPDGRRVVFNRRLGEWPREYDMGIYRRVVCWTDIPERD